MQNIIDAFYNFHDLIWSQSKGEASRLAQPKDNWKGTIWLSVCVK